MKGSTHLEWILALIIFLSGFILAISYVKASMNIKIPEEKFISDIMENLEQEIEKISVKTNVYKIITPEICVEHYPCEFEIKNMLNFSVLNSTNGKQVANFENDKLRTLVNWCDKNKIVEVNESVSPPQGDAWVSSTALGNGDVSITYNSTHILSIKYNSKEFLVKPAKLNTSQILERKSDTTQAKVIFDSLNLSVDSFSPRIWIISQPKNLTFNLTFFQNCYIANTLYDCSSLSSLSKISNLTSLYNSSTGISFIGNNLNVTLVNNGNESLAINLTNVEKFEIYFQKGSYTLAENESKAFSYSCTLLPYITYQPISYQKLVSQGIELQNVNYRIEIENLVFGDNIPLLANIYRREIPTLIVKDGVLNTTKMVLWVWK